MAQKRRNGDEVDEMTGREKKKLKVAAARTIAIQSTSSGASSSAGHSKNNVAAKNSLAGLPTAIDVEKFIEARAFEIDAMHTAMKTASASSTHRAWQTLPRHLRRRAASHDVRRVPLKLREKARAEMDPARKKALVRSMPKLGKGKGPTRTEAFHTRKEDRIWLETHIWHAKRMHMEDLWGYRLAVSPTEKSYRPSHRASVHGSILHDASYYSMIEIKGPEEVLIKLLDLCCDPQGSGPGSKRYLNGSRVLETYIYSVASYPFDLISPLTIIWRSQSSISPQTTESTGATCATTIPGIKQTQPTHVSTSVNIRSVWLKFHPSVQATIFKTLKEATSRALSSYNALHGDSEEATVEILDLRGQLNIFEITGPKSTQVIRGAISPTNSERGKEFTQFWSSLKNLQSSGSVPRGMIIGFKVNDPRLKFPPTNAKPAPIPQDNVSPAVITLPSANLANSEIWESSIRNGLSKPRFKKKDIDERRSTNEIPGMPLQPLRQDDCIPVLLMQRSTENPNFADNKGVHGWTLIFPAGWSMAFLSSFVYTNTRVAGQSERQTQAYEAGTTYFPRDYPFTEPYELYAQDRESKAQETWKRKPPAKRVNFEELGTASPWRIKWEGVLGITKRMDDIGGTEAVFVPSQREPASTTDFLANQLQKTIRPWLLRGPEVPKILSSMASFFNFSAILLFDVNRLRLKRGHEPLPNTHNAHGLLQGALVNIQLLMCSRGTPEDLAEIYIIPDDLFRQWERFLQTQQASTMDDEDNPVELELAHRVPASATLIGHVTTGHYSLARGRGFAIGAIALTRLMELEQQTTRLHPNRKSPPMLVVVRNIDGLQYRAARLEVLLDA